MELFLAGWLVFVNAGAFLLFGVDKRRARRGRWRISERTLFLFPLLGGAPGGIAGMYCFRHKTLHRRFRYGLPAIAFCHVLLACLWLLYTHGWLRLPPAGGAYLCMKGP